MLKNYLKDLSALDRKITIQTKDAEIIDEYGHSTGQTYTTREVWGAYSFGSKNESNVLSKESQEQVLYFIIRYTPLTLLEQVIYEGITYDIVNIEPIGRKRFLKITLTKTV